MATVSANQGDQAPSTSTSSRSQGFMKVALPHLIAIGVQLPMFLLFFRQMMSKTHYQTIWLAVIATAAIAWNRWPRDQRTPYRESLASNVLLIAGLIMGVGFGCVCEHVVLCCECDAVDHQPAIKSGR